ncbi:AraC family transcriptional regulator [Sphingobacterium paramultivorum]|uniref:AraC family transcriptional regulator n=1 Tax=Sphingobacterium paramultivorum TaxID=2886510 RepID=A0A7G5E4H8_9SPHI|nr:MULTISPECIES: helix-turn-helix domain-containing protein [Sphingobacterium]QMV68903.1 AraC family transcriptional regulator [Sphingobacterium paramultivorum]WET69909.1 MAG: helix-turn-helix domain-containing protein [Sphingobacterium sp.]WSO12678.1 helix-turn-helix domain-containing protein [Sphingobacterium paramultivorum]
MKTTSIEQFYQEINAGIPKEIAREIGHFNVFSFEELAAKLKDKPVMPYNKRTYYKISLITGKNIAEYADKVIEIDESALVFATPKVPYHWIPKDEDQKGYFCVFTDEFLARNKSGVIIDDLPIFQPGGLPIFQISPEQRIEVEEIFLKMNKELSSDYVFKYDLLRNYVLEIIHYGQKLQPKSMTNPTSNASNRITSLFIELLERQFPIESPMQRLQLRTANDFAERLAIHVNHLNKTLKENTGKTTSHVIAARIVQEAKILLRQTDWNISEIAFSLGFEEIAHFSNFFKKQTGLAPNNFRSQTL